MNVIDGWIEPTLRIKLTPMNLDLHLRGFGRVSLNGQLQASLSEVALYN